MTQAVRPIIATAARAAPNPIPIFAPSLKEKFLSAAADSGAVTVTVAGDPLVGAGVVADCEDAAASNCCGGGARNVSFVGLLQAWLVPQQAHKFVLRL